MLIIYFAIMMFYFLCLLILLCMYILKYFNVFVKLQGPVLDPGGTHMLKHTGMCRPNWLLFQQKSLDMGPILVKKNP